MFAFAKDATSINDVEDHIKIMGFVGKATIIAKKVATLAAWNVPSGTNGRSG
jgi:hypothetical protein